jgi:hypothetical protein
MYFAQFFHKSAISDEIIEACGDRSVITLDGRLSKQTMGEISAIECKKRGYLAWQVWQGESFTRSKPVSQLWFVSNDKPTTNPAWLSAHGM